MTYLIDWILAYASMTINEVRHSGGRAQRGNDPQDVGNVAGGHDCMGAGGRAKQDAYRDVGGRECLEQILEPKPRTGVRSDPESRSNNLCLSDKYLPGFRVLLRSPGMTRFIFLRYH